jgi:hypothetical protein
MSLNQTEDVVIKAKVKPKAKKDEIVVIKANQVKISIKAPPQAGKANEACIALLAKVLGITKKEIKLLLGKTSREKVFLIKGKNNKEVRKRLGIK